MDPNIISRNIAIRNELDLFVYVIHCQAYPGVKSRYSDVDFFVIRQNTEGEYSNMEHEVGHVYISAVFTANSNLNFNTMNLY